MASSSISSRLRQSACTPWALLGLLWLAHAAFNIYWLKTDTQPLYYDMASHALVVVRLARSISFADLAGSVGAIAH